MANYDRIAPSFRKVLLCMGVLFCVPAAVAEEIDRRNGPAAPGEYSAAFVARRDGTVGHAFVILYSEDHKAKASTDIAYGLYPIDGKDKWHIGVFPAKVLEELLKDRDKISQRLDVRLDEKVYRQLQTYIDQERAKSDKGEQSWALLWHDCVSFTRKCAQIAGLKVPARLLSLKPEAAVEAIIKANVKRGDGEPRRAG